MRGLYLPPATAICAVALASAAALTLASADDTPREWHTVVRPSLNAPASPARGPIIQRSSVIESGIAAFTDSPDIPITPAMTTTQSENSVFVSPLDPHVLLNSNNSSNWPLTAFFGASYWTSTDGGLTWTGSVNGAGGTNRGDPAAAIDRNGRMFVGYVSYEYGQGVAYSDDNGATWTPRTVAPAPSVLDKNHLWVDNGASSPYMNHLYSAWTNFQGGADDTQIEIMRSTDGGVTWTDRQTLSGAVAAGSHNQGVNIQTGPNGEVYVAWSIYDCWPCEETAIGFTRSLDGGQSFSPSQRVLTGIRGHRLTPLGGDKTMRHNSFPSMTVNQQTGEIFMVWTNLGAPEDSTGDPDIYLVRSSDGGTSWSAPRRVNQDPVGNGKDTYFPWIACDPVTGLLACIYYDCRNFPANDMVETFVATSTDHGVTWEDFRVSDVAWSGDAMNGFGEYAGDYLGIALRENHVYPTWSDDRTGNMLAYLSPFVIGPDLHPPVAAFSASPVTGLAPLAVRFTDLSARGPTAWRWDFGDGGSSTEQHPSHIYLNPGTYSVSLTASNDSGSDVETKPNYIIVSAPAPPPPPAPVIHVHRITVARAGQGAMWKADAAVTIVDQNGAPVGGATVQGVFNAPDSRMRKANTNAAGVAMVGSFKTKTPPANWCFTVANVVKSGQVYDPTRNVVNSACESGTAEIAVAAGGGAEPSLAAADGAAGRADIVASDRARIEFRLDTPSHVRVEVFDVGGRRIATLADGQIPAGEHGYTWDRRGVPSGVYFYRVRGANLLQTGKILVLAP